MYKNDEYLYMLDYSDENKNLNIKHKIDLYDNYRFKNLIETQKDHIIIKEKRSFTIWKKQNNADDDNIYSKIETFEGKFDILFNLNDSLFLSIQNNNNENFKTKINFYENEKYNIIKTLIFSLIFKSIHKLNNETLVLICDEMDKFIFIDIKYFELVQIMEYQPSNYSYLISNNYFLLEFVLNEDKNEMRVRKLNVKNACFENCGIMKTRINQEINLTSNNLVFFTQSNALQIFKL